MCVRKISQELADTKLLAKLSEDDMVATETKYHWPCLAQFYNRYHNHNRKKGPATNQLEVIKDLFYFIFCYMPNLHGISRYTKCSK